MGLHDLGAAKKSNYCTWNNWRHRREWREEITREQVSLPIILTGSSVSFALGNFLLVLIVLIF